MSAAKAKPVAAPELPGLSPDTQEVRLATTMTGGVSLAIWMGGFTRELDLLQQASRWRETNQEPPPPTDPHDRAAQESVLLYGKLIGLMDVLVDTDVLSGTSAGGINAILLAIARVRGRDLGNLRNIWMNVAALRTLLRDPTDTDIPSLLYGDQRMFAEIKKGIGELPPANLPENLPADARRRPTALYVTTTLLTGESGRFTDSFGTEVQDTDQRGVFTFRAEQLAESANDGALALAARSTASFPGAFEPSYLPADQTVPAQTGVPPRPAMRAFTGITRDHWVADGGILNNRPINLVIDDIFRRSASGPVRRVLLYVVPSSGPAPNPVPQAPQDAFAAPYGLLDGLLKDLTARLHASIAADLAAIRRHNDDASARADLRLWIADKHGTRTGRLLTPGVLLAFGRQVSDRVSRDVVRSMLQLLTSWPPARKGDDGGGGATVPLNWQGVLAPHGGAEAVIGAAAAAVVTGRFRPTRGLPKTSADLATYGRAAFDGGLSVALDVLRTAEVLADKVQRFTISLLVSKVHTIDTERSSVPLDEITFGKCGDPKLRCGSIADAAAAITTDFADEQAVPDHAWSVLADVLQQAFAALPMMTEDIMVDLTSVTPVPAAADAAARLMSFVRYLRLGGDTDEVMRRLFDLAVTERSLLPVDAGPQQRVEFVQASADTRCLLTPDRSTAQQKLTGMQLHHFGAFYKKSWRANDWMWGRLDGAGWLVHVLLDPSRVRHIAQLRAPQGARANWFAEQLTALFGTSADPALSAAAFAELSFLDDDMAPTPASLPLVSLWVAQAWQRRIADDEARVLAETILGDGKEPADESPASSVEWAKKAVVPDADRAKLLASCPVPNETFRSDLGTPLFVTTVAKTAATTMGALDGVRQVPGGLRPAIKTARTTAVAGYRLVNKVGGVTWSIILAGLVIFAAGLGLQEANITVLGGWPLLGALVGGYLMVLGVWQLSFRVVGALIAMTITVAVFGLTTPRVRHWLFGTPAHAGGGWVGRHVYWLGSVWWHPLAGLGVLLLAVTLYGVLLARLPLHAKNGVRQLKTLRHSA